MTQLCMVTGANGHLGNNLIRTLINNGEKVRAGVRDTQNNSMFEGLDCELVYAEMLDKDAMLAALEGVDVLYHVAAVFKHWAKDPETEIIQANIKGTEVVLEAAAQTKVKKVVYVSSVAAIGHNGEPLNESHWNDEPSNAYYQSKIRSEKKAWQLAEKLDLWMVTVQPSAMIGPNAANLTDTMKFINDIQTKSLPFNPNFFFNFVDVRDVAQGIYAAACKGKHGNRYILANDQSSSLSEIINAANTVKADYTLPSKSPKWLLLTIAWFMELGAKVSGKPAELISSQVKLFYGVKQEYDISKAQRDLGYAPRSPMKALIDTFQYLEKRSPL
jgi:dihydroflavonol-4-reductase